VGLATRAAVGWYGSTMGATDGTVGRGGEVRASAVPGRPVGAPIGPGGMRGNTGAEGSAGTTSTGVVGSAPGTPLAPCGRPAASRASGPGTPGEDVTGTGAGGEARRGPRERGGPGRLGDGLRVACGQSPRTGGLSEPRPRARHQPQQRHENRNGARSATESYGHVFLQLARTGAMVRGGSGRLSGSARTRTIAREWDESSAADA
jgi:hypothetical protein